MLILLGPEYDKCHNISDHPGNNGLIRVEHFMADE